MTESPPPFELIRPIRVSFGSVSPAPGSSLRSLRQNISLRISCIWSISRLKILPKFASIRVIRVKVPSQFVFIRAIRVYGGAVEPLVIDVTFKSCRCSAI